MMAWQEASRVSWACREPAAAADLAAEMADATDLACRQDRVTAAQPSQTCNVQGAHSRVAYITSCSKYHHAVDKPDTTRQQEASEKSAKF